MRHPHLLPYRLLRMRCHDRYCHDHPWDGCKDKRLTGPGPIPLHLVFALINTHGRHNQAHKQATIKLRSSSMNGAASLEAWEAPDHGILLEDLLRELSTTATVMVVLVRRRVLRLDKTTARGQGETRPNRDTAFQRTEVL
jgi:hypothetical protein